MTAPAHARFVRDEFASFDEALAWAVGQIERHHLVEPSLAVEPYWAEEDDDGVLAGDLRYSVKVRGDQAAGDNDTFTLDQEGTP